MVSSLSYKLGQNQLVTGFGTRRAPAKKGRGVIRNIASAGTKALGTYLVNKLADVIKGNGFKPTGYGRKPRTTLKRKTAKK